MNKDKNSKIFNYIELLENDSYGEIITSNRNEDGVLNMPYINYSETVNNFIKDFYDSSFIRYNYMDNLEDIIDKPIESLDKEELCCLITSYIRLDRFSDGYLLEKLKNGDLIKALKALKKY